MMNFTISAYCPECGHTNKRVIAARSMTSLEMWTCDQDSGGCDREFVIEVTVPTPTVKVLKLTEAE